MRPARSPRRSVGRAVAASLLAAAPLAAQTPPAAADSVQLPALPTALAPDEPCTPASSETAREQTWTRQALGLRRSWSLADGHGVTVGVVDTGVGTDIPALAGRVEAVGDAGTDCVGHGSFAAGLIAAAPRQGVGVAGAAPAARVLAVRGTDKRGKATAEQLADGVRAAVDGGARVVYVGRAVPDGKAELTAAVEYATQHDALVVAPFAPDVLPKDSSTGRTSEPAPRYWPAAAPGVLSVMDYGPDGTRPKDAPQVKGAKLAAPGDAVVSVGPSGSGHYIGSGSSLAAANVAGAAALVRSRKPKMTAAEVSRQLVTAGYPAVPPRVDPYAALTAVLPDKQGTVPSPPPAKLPPQASPQPLNRALLIAGAGGTLVLLVAGAAVVIPRGRARGWRPAGAPEERETAT
ncbi:S8 family serine peptidase [Streptomyces tubbatahanensis]|uniref:S8 family serine peptidase n=1 Tax=Streptomyces tubbatahanensis TaxID=2923272 RepID=A0ABY3XZ52_9ACTN|nr:S8 family serine peptidase [Streptomyces tubbatahanensis]UNS99665.1 S8 family serine peptidase [Streptomyces tubbatahanensis]